MLFLQESLFVSCSKAVSEWTLVWWLQIITKSPYYSKQCVPIASLVFTDLLMVSTRLRKLGNESKGDKNMLQRLAGQVEIRPSKIISLFDRLSFDKRY